MLSYKERYNLLQKLYKRRKRQGKKWEWNAETIREVNSFDPVEWKNRKLLKKRKIK